MSKTVDNFEYIVRGHIARHINSTTYARICALMNPNKSLKYSMCKVGTKSPLRNLVLSRYTSLLFTSSLKKMTIGEMYISNVLGLRGEYSVKLTFSSKNDLSFKTLTIAETLGAQYTWFDVDVGDAIKFLSSRDSASSIYFFQYVEKQASLLSRYPEIRQIGAPDSMTFREFIKESVAARTMQFNLSIIDARFNRIRGTPAHTAPANASGSVKSLIHVINPASMEVMLRSSKSPSLINLINRVVSNLAMPGVYFSVKPSDPECDVWSANYLGKTVTLEFSPQILDDFNYYATGVDSFGLVIESDTYLRGEDIPGYPGASPAEWLATRVCDPDDPIIEHEIIVLADKIPLKKYLTGISFAIREEYESFLNMPGIPFKKIMRA